MGYFLAQLAQLAEQGQQVAPSGGISADGWKVISFLCAAVGGMFLWLKLKDKRIDELQEARVADLKEHLKRVVDENDKD